MKKVCLIGILLFAFSIIDCFAYDTQVWQVVSKDSIPNLPYENKVGDYYFDIIEDDTREFYLHYSTDGVRFIKTEFRTRTLPRYNDGLYFIIDDHYRDVPENKRYVGFSNSPSYILDSELNQINIIIDKCYTEYCGYYDGYHYLSKDYYEGESVFFGIYSSQYLYKTKDGINIEHIERDTFPKILSFGKLLFDGTYYEVPHKPSDDDEIGYIYNDNDTYTEVVIESPDRAAQLRTVSNDDMVYFFTVKIGEASTETNSYNRSYLYGLYDKYLTSDGIYGVLMPDDIGDYVVELDGKLYFEKDVDNYYCIDRSELTNNIKVIYDNKILAFDKPPVIENDRTLVSMRFLFEQMGADVEWIESTGTAVVTQGSDTISFSIDNINAEVNGAIKPMDVPARLIGGKTMIPLRFLSEELGYTVDWDSDTGTATIFE